MLVVSVICISFGAILSWFFKVYCLIPAIALSLLLILSNPFQFEYSLIGLFAFCALSAVMLQVGFFCGIATQAFWASFTHFATRKRVVTVDKRRLNEFELLTDRDVLTGIANRQAFLKALQAEIDRVQMHKSIGARGSTLCIAFMDINRFEQLNDEKRHLVGDAALCGVADRLAEIMRRSDTLARLGGEEFAVCMPGVALRDGKAIAHRLRRAVAAQPFDTPSGPLAMTLSIGVAAFKAGDSPTTLLERADARMYVAKKAGSCSDPISSAVRPHFIV